MNVKDFSISVIIGVAFGMLSAFALLNQGVIWAQQGTDQILPTVINYQGRLSDSNGEPLTGTYDMQFCLYANPIGGDALWCEMHDSATTTAVTVLSGVFDVQLGSHNSLTNSIFGGSDLFLGVSVENDAEMIPRRQLTSTGFAMLAANSDTLDGLNSSDFALNDQVTAVEADIADLQIQIADLQAQVSGPSANQTLFETGYLTSTTRSVVDDPAGDISLPIPEMSFSTEITSSSSIVLLMFDAAIKHTEDYTYCRVRIRRNGVYLEAPTAGAPTGPTTDNIFWQTNLTVIDQNPDIGINNYEVFRFSMATDPLLSGRCEYVAPQLRWIKIQN